MKLISCHVENFGGLYRYDLEFEPGLTVIQAENGFGKTTLAEFIRTMFYGFPRKSPRSLGKRQKYRPWNGKKCGGSLTFSHNGKNYRLERTFGATPRGDSFNLMDLETGQRSTDFTEDIGLEIFGLDADSFERSTYLPQSREQGPLSTDSIRAKLGGLVEDEQDVGGYEKAMKRLHDCRSELIPYTAAATRGSVAEAGRQITAIQQALDRAEDCAVQLENTAGEMARLEEDQARTAREIEDVRTRLTAATEAAARLAYRQQLARLEGEARQTAAELAALKGQYPKGLPTREELEELSDAVDRRTRLTATPLTAADENAQRYVEENQSRFGGGTPTEGEITRMRQTCDDYRSLSAQVEGCTLTAEDAAGLQQAQAFLAPGIPGEEVLLRHAVAGEEAERLRRENLKLAAQSGGAVPAEKGKISTPVLLLAALGAVAVTAGIILFATSMTALGGGALGLGLVSLLAAGYLSLRTAMNRQSPGMNTGVQAMIRENEARAAQLEENIRAFTSLYTPDAPMEALRRIREQTQRLHILTQRQEELSRRREALTAQMDGCNDSLKDFFTRYFPTGYSGSGYDLLARLQRESDAWERALCQLEDRDERLERHHRETQAVAEVLGRCRERYGLMPRTREQVLRIRDDARRMAELEPAAALLARQVAEFSDAHADALTDPAPGGAEDPNLLRRRERELLDGYTARGEALLRLGQQRRRLREEADRAPELRDQLAQWQEKREADRERAAVLDDTMAFLEQARTELALAYMGPIRESFAGLMARMTGEEQGRILVTPELEVRLDRDGESRELAYFSAGQTDLVMLCMRLALVDALFREAKPFVILDDPFVNLDDERTREALGLLRDLSRDRQIIYMTCHSSRV